MKSMLSTFRLDDIAEFTNGGAWNQEEYSGSGIPVTRVSDIHGGTVDLSSCKYLPESCLAKYSKNRLQEGDLIICTVGSHPTQPGSVVGRAGIVPRSAEGSLLNQNAVCVRPKTERIDKRWLGYIGKSEGFHDYIKAHARGSASQVRMAIGLLKEMPIQVPDLPTQRKIAGILSAYDDLIENNLRRIKILEEMAQSLYREWFVHFRFPGHESVSLVDSPPGPIPDGWEVATIGDLCSFVGSGGTPKRSEETYWEGGTIDWYKTKELWDSHLFEAEEKITPEGLKRSAARLVEPGTILMAIYGSPTVGRLGIATRRATCNQAALALRSDPQKASQEFLYYSLFGLRDYFNSIAQGAAQQNISKQKVVDARILLPTTVLLGKFSAQVATIWEALLNLRSRNQSLRRNRELLLPKLLQSG
jgi:type I restriction enzyme S subunit